MKQKYIDWFFERYKIKSWGIFRQYLATFTVNLVVMSIGCLLGWTAPTLPRLEQPNSVLQITRDQGSWIASSLLLGAIIGVFIAGYLADKVGRRITLLIDAVPLVISWLLITIAGVAQSVPMIYAGRFIGGMALSGAYAISAMYSGEIAQDRIRGSLGSLQTVLRSFGLLYMYSIGPYVSYVWLGIAGMLIPILFAVTFYFMPESPYYLLMKGKQEEAGKALQWLRDTTVEEAQLELMEAKVAVDESMKNKGSIKDLFASRESIKALYLSSGIFIFQNLVGSVAVLFYSTSIFQMASPTMDSDVSTIIIGAVFCIASLISPFIADRLGRRPMLIISATGMCVALTIIGTFFYLKDVTGIDLTSVRFIPVLSLVAYQAFWVQGFGSLTPVLMSELFPTNVKGIGLSFTTSFASIATFLTTKYFQDIADATGTYTAFWILSGFCVLAGAFVFFLLPETRGKSLEEIQNILQKC